MNDKQKIKKLRLVLQSLGIGDKEADVTNPRGTMLSAEQVKNATIVMIQTKGRK